MKPEATHPNYAQPPLFGHVARDTIVLPAPKTICECVCPSNEPAAITTIAAPSLWPLAIVVVALIAFVGRIWRTWPRALS